MSRGWDARRKAFVQAYDSSALDASSLLMPLVFFMAPNDPRMLQTVDAIRQPLAAGGLVPADPSHLGGVDCLPTSFGLPR